MFIVLRSYESTKPIVEMWFYATQAVKTLVFETAIKTSKPS